MMSAYQNGEQEAREQLAQCEADGEAMAAEIATLRATEARMRKALEECMELAGRNGPPNEIDACNEIERVAKAALSASGSPAAGVVVPRRLVERAIEFIETGAEPMEDGERGVPEALRALLGDHNA